MTLERVPQDTGITFVRPNKKALVVRRNDLIFGSYKMTLQETRLFLWLVSEVQEGDADFKRYRITISDFCDLVGIEGESLYSRMAAITRSMIQRVIEVNDLDEKTLRQRPLVSGADYAYGAGYVELELHRDLKPYLVKLKEHFTAIELGIAIRLKSFYAVRIYEILKAKRFKGHRIEWELGELRRLVGVEPGEYERFDNFKARVLEPAVNELNMRTDLRVSYEPRRTGRLVSHITFDVHERREIIGFAAGTRKDKLFRDLRGVGMPEKEGMACIEQWADSDPDRIAWHVAEMKRGVEAGKIKSGLAWLRVALKSDYRSQRALEFKARQLDEEDRARDAARRNDNKGRAGKLVSIAEALKQP